MNILLTNDDGYDSKGIRLLQKLLSKYGHVVIVAPNGPRSGKSVSLTLGQPLELKEVEKNVYISNGTPADCVSMGLCCFNIDFDLVVSGCNNGLNISYDTMYSGTIGACLEALIFRKPAIAFSAHHGDDLSLLEKHFDEIMEFIKKNDLLSSEYLLNINMPKDEVKGISLGNLYYRKDQNYFVKEEDGLYAYRYMQENFDEDKNSDCYQVEHGIVSIVPLNKHLFNPKLKEELERKMK